MYGISSSLTYEAPTLQFVQGESSGDDIAQHSSEADADRC